MFDPTVEDEISFCRRIDLWMWVIWKNIVPVTMQINIVSFSIERGERVPKICPFFFLNWPFQHFVSRIGGSSRRDNNFFEWI